MTHHISLNSDQGRSQQAFAAMEQCAPPDQPRLAGFPAVYQVLNGNRPTGGLAAVFITQWTHNGTISASELYADENGSFTYRGTLFHLVPETLEAVPAGAAMQVPVSEAFEHRQRVFRPVTPKFASYALLSNLNCQQKLAVRLTHRVLKVWVEAREAEGFRPIWLLPGNKRTPKAGYFIPPAKSEQNWHFVCASTNYIAARKPHDGKWTDAQITERLDELVHIRVATVVLGVFSAHGSKFHVLDGDVRWDDRETSATTAARVLIEAAFTKGQRTFRLPPGAKPPFQHGTKTIIAPVEAFQERFNTPAVFTVYSTLPRPMEFKETGEFRVQIELRRKSESTGREWYVANVYYILNGEWTRTQVPVVNGMFTFRRVRYEVTPEREAKLHSLT